jgi:hypothetical protein
LREFNDAIGNDCTFWTQNGGLAVIPIIRDEMVRVVEQPPRDPATYVFQADQSEFYFISREKFHIIPPTIAA